MNKTEIRKIYLEKRKKLSIDEVHHATQAMLHLFNDLHWENIKTVLSYSPIGKRKEFDAFNCEKAMVARNAKIKIAHPRIIKDSSFMEAVVVNAETLFVDNDYFIREPFHGEILTPESIDMVLVPLLAFDEKGFRVGYGKGFYDRWLAQCRPGIDKVGFSFFDPLRAIDDINEFDVPLSLCITPTRVYEF